MLELDAQKFTLVCYKVRQMRASKCRPLKMEKKLNVFVSAFFMIAFMIDQRTIETHRFQP